MKGNEAPEDWRKSSYSAVNGNCVEVAAVWRKASVSHANGNCVETAACPCGMLVRDSRDPDGPRLSFAPDEWRQFVAAVKRD